MADGIGLLQSGLNDTVRLSRSIGNQDDGISIAEWVYALVQSAMGTRTLQVQGPFGAALEQGQSYALPNGANVLFEATDGTILGSANIVSQTTPQYVNGTAQMSFTFDANLPSGLAGAYMYPTAPALRGGGMTLDRNTTQRQTSGAGISIWGPSNITVSGNYVHRTHWTGINLIHSLVQDNWISPPTVNANLFNNVVDGTNLFADSSGNQLGGVQLHAHKRRKEILRDRVSRQPG
jgi:hypothetical protein